MQKKRGWEKGWKSFNVHWQKVKKDKGATQTISKRLPWRRTSKHKKWRWGKHEKNKNKKKYSLLTKANKSNVCLLAGVTQRG